MTIEDKVEVGTKILLRAMFIFLALVFLYFIRDIAIIVIMAILLAAALDAPVTAVGRYRVPRGVAVLLVYVLLLVILVVLVSFLIPPLFEQLRELALYMPTLWQEAVASLGWGGVPPDEGTLFKNVEEQLISTSNLFSTTAGIFSGIVSFFVLFFLSFYMSLEEKGIEKFLASVSPVQYQKYVVWLTQRIQTKVGQWLFGQVLLMIIIFVVYFIGLEILGVPYALALALLGGLLEIVPYIGPVVAGIPAVILGFSVSPVIGFAVLIFYAAIQQLENHVIIPQVMRRTVGLNPVAVIVALLIGAKLAGVLGIILAVPIAAIIGIVVEDFLGNQNSRITN